MAEYIRSIFINKMWFVAIFAFVMVLSVTRAISAGVREIERATEDTHQRIDELMNEQH